MAQGKKRTVSRRRFSDNTVSIRKQRAVCQQGNPSSGHSHIPCAPGHLLSNNDTRTRTARSQTTIDNTSQENPLSANPTAAGTAIPLDNHRVIENRVSEAGLDQPSSLTTPLTHDNIPAIVHTVMDNLPTRTNNCSLSPLSCENSSNMQSAPQTGQCTLLIFSTTKVFNYVSWLYI